MFTSLLLKIKHGLQRPAAWITGFFTVKFIDQSSELITAVIRIHLEESIKIPPYTYNKSCSSEIRAEGYLWEGITSEL